MTSEKALNNKGFTLIELIIVIAILGVLAAVLIPNYIGYIEKAKIGVDNANLVVLNEDTAIYKDIKGITTADVFDSITTDAARMQKLVSEGCLAAMVSTQQKNATFVWDIPSQKWVTSVLASGGTIAVTGVTLAESSIIVAKSGSGDKINNRKLTVNVLPQDATNKAVIWTTSDANYATVSPDGIVSFVNQISWNTNDYILITVTTVDGSKTASCKVHTQW